MKQYNLLNTVMGWVVFAIAAITYILTLEPTASFWDCGEFIASAYKLEVGHPPGNPIFMLTGRFFANFASDPSQVAYLINLMSALLSAGTILFLFWTITYLAKKLIHPDGEQMTVARMITILGCGLVGALAYTWSDTFWYSAVEGEVYAYSSFCTAVVFWLILKWDSVADEPYANRYLILIAYLIGVSIAVHLLNLLCIPAIVLVYYYRKFKNVNAKGSLLALLVSFGIIVLLLYGIVPGFVKVAGWFELLCVNTLGLPFNSGVIIYFLLTMGTIVWAIYETFANKNELRTHILFLCSIILSGMPFITDNLFIGLAVCVAIILATLYFKYFSVKVMNTVLAALLVILIGYSSYALILIRSAANTPMDQNSPEDIFTLGSYLNREQYGDTPLLYGQTFVSKVKRVNGEAQVKEGKNIYQKAVKKNADEPDRYVVTGKKESYIYESDTQMFFPRMHSNKPNHVSAYKEWSGATAGKKPTFAQNLQFFLDYQLNHMYWRYFLWNFAGRQNDIQGHGEVDKGNWISGFNFIDKYRVGEASTLPDELADNPGRNVFYMLPLILGIVGLLYQAFAGKRGIEQFWVTFFLFFMTGIAIVLYLNQTPYQPRERDYAYAGSFYAYTIWIGLGVAAIARGLERVAEKVGVNNKVVPAAVASVLCLCVPLQMVSQTWDDHDRSGRYIARDFGMNYLSSLEPNAVIFTNGDNDTFPLWYAQEVEGYRTDVRVCNLSYFQTDWYADQMKRPAYDSEALPISMPREKYMHDKYAYSYIIPIADWQFSATDALDFLYSDDPKTKRTQYGTLNYIPTDKIYIPVDSATAIKNAGIPVGYEEYVEPNIVPNLNGKSGLYFYETASLDMINSNIQQGWQRPIYYAVTVSSDLYLGLQDYFALTGLAYHVVPIKTAVCGGVDTERMYDNMMNKFRWGGLEKATPEDPIYLDENVRRMCQTTRVMFNELVNQLIVEGKNEKALAALQTIDEKMPEWLVPYEGLAIQMATNYLTLGEKERAKEIIFDSIERSLQYIGWYKTLSPQQLRSVGEKDLHNYILQAGLTLLVDNGMEADAQQIVNEARAAGLI